MERVLFGQLQLWGKVVSVIFKNMLWTDQENAKFGKESVRTYKNCKLLLVQVMLLVSLSVYGS